MSEQAQKPPMLETLVLNAKDALDSVLSLMRQKIYELMDENEKLKAEIAELKQPKKEGA